MMIDRDVMYHTSFQTEDGVIHVEQNELGHVTFYKSDKVVGKGYYCMVITSMAAERLWEDLSEK